MATNTPIRLSKTAGFDIRWYNIDGYRYLAYKGDTEQGQSPWVAEIWSTREVGSGGVLRDSVIHSVGWETLRECREWITAHLNGSGDFRSFDRHMAAINSVVYSS